MKQLNQNAWKVILKRHEAVLGTLFSGELGSAGLRIRLNDLRDLFLAP